MEAEETAAGTEEAAGSWAWKEVGKAAGRRMPALAAAAEVGRSRRCDKSLKTDGERRCFSHHGVFESSMEKPMMERMRCVGKTYCVK